jgi:hypothetical protein
MHTWTDIVTAIGDLLTLATAAINLAAAIHTRPRHGQQTPHNRGEKAGQR